MRHLASWPSERCAMVNFKAALSHHFADTDDTEMHYCGPLIFQCKHCNANFFLQERLSSATNRQFSLCCGNGKVMLWTIPGPITFPQSILSVTDVGIVPLDNLCLTDINSPRSKCNAKPQSREAQLWLVFLVSCCHPNECVKERYPCQSKNVTNNPT